MTSTPRSYDPIQDGQDLLNAVYLWHQDAFNENLCKKLIARGADLSMTDKGGHTALITASIRGHTGVVEALLDKGADIEAQAQNESTPLILAIMNKKTDTAKILLRHGANIHARNCYGSTPLICAAENGNAEITRLLLHMGANLDDTDKSLHTASAHAKRRRYSNIIDMIQKESERRITRQFRTAAEKGTVRARKIKRPQTTHGKTP
ncbi:MAG: ankyrin repeat domain-containing protein [Alphaproteobacteria bacterium]|nr:ankyrin repeat domain-containing protein [Alphaproteobacteria bacterium]